MSYRAGIKNFISRYQILYFIFLAYGITWGLKLLYHFVRDPGNLIMFNFSLLAQFGPMLAGLFVVITLEGKKGFERMISSIFVKETGNIWLSISVVFEPFLFGGIVFCYWITGGEFQILNNSSILRSIMSLFTTFAVGIFWWGMSEEVGWSGFLLPKLQSLFSPFKASIVLAVITTLWHFNPNLPGQFTDFREGLAIWGYYSPMLEQLLISVPITFVTTYIFNKSGGSLLAMMLFHSASNASYFWIKGVFDIVHTTFFRTGFLVLFWVAGIGFAYLLTRQKDQKVTWEYV